MIWVFFSILHFKGPLFYQDFLPAERVISFSSVLPPGDLLREADRVHPIFHWTQTWNDSAKKEKKKKKNLKKKELIFAWYAAGCGVDTVKPHKVQHEEDNLFRK